MFDFHPILVIPIFYLYIYTCDNKLMYKIIMFINDIQFNLCFLIIHFSVNKSDSGYWGSCTDIMWQVPAISSGGTLRWGGDYCASIEQYFNDIPLHVKCKNDSFLWSYVKISPLIFFSHFYGKKLIFTCGFFFGCLYSCKLFMST